MFYLKKKNSDRSPKKRNWLYPKKKSFHSLKWYWQDYWYPWRRRRGRRRSRGRATSRAEIVKYLQQDCIIFTYSLPLYLQVSWFLKKMDEHKNLQNKSLNMDFFFQGDVLLFKIAYLKKMRKSPVYQ